MPGSWSEYLKLVQRVICERMLARLKRYWSTFFSTTASMQQIYRRALAFGRPPVSI
jgi:hypothetical protein